MEEILHAGDVCKGHVLTEIEAIAPVVAVHGNCDARDLVERLPAERRIERAGVSILLLHGHQAGRASAERIARLALAKADLVVFGHSHEPCDEVLGGVRFFNPGTAGGVGRSPSVGILTIEGGRIDLEHVALPRR